MLTCMTIKILTSFLQAYQQQYASLYHLAVSDLKIEAK